MEGSPFAELMAGKITYWDFCIRLDRLQQSRADQLPAEAGQRAVGTEAEIVEAPEES